MEFKSISIIIPTLNSNRTIGDCLDSIVSQNYPKDKIEIIIADGGSTDKTLQIINSIKSMNPINLRILPNRLKTGEAGKALAAKAASNEIAAFIDSDNILPSSDWLKKMVEPFLDPEIIAAEPLEYTYRRSDGYITRYCALVGMNDPLCLFLGNYDRYNYITGRWTGMPHKEEDKGNYLKVQFEPGSLPTVGANGFLIRKVILDKYNTEDYLFDIDVLCELLATSHDLKVAKVKIGIIHIFAGGFLSFIHKQRRRIKDYAYYKKLNLRKYKWGGIRLSGMIKFILYSVLLFPLALQALKGYAAKKDAAWLFHAPACLASFFVYSLGAVMNFFISKPLSRDKWQLSDPVR